MNRSMSVLVGAIMAVAGCADNSTDPAAESPIPRSTATIPTASDFAGVWRATSPHPDFIRLTVASKSSEQGALAARLTFSGIYWEGSGRIEGDAFVANMATPGVTSSNRVLTARVSDAGTLRVTMRATDGSSSTEFTFVRES